MKYKTYKKILVLLALFLSMRLSGQVATSNDIFNFTLDQLYKTKVVTATKQHDEIFKVPSVVFVIPHLIIEERNYHSLADLLDDLPQILVHRKASAEDYNVFTINGVTGNDKFLILINGVRVTSLMGADHTIAESYSLDDVERVEIVLGPGSVLYGADAYVGVINLITFDYSRHQPQYFSLSAGNFGTYRLSALTSFKHKNLSYGGLIKFYKSDEPFYPDYYPKAFAWWNYYQQTGFMKKGNDTVKPELPIQPWGIPTYSAHIDLFAKYKSFEAGIMNFFERHSTSLGDSPSTAIYTDKAKYSTKINNFYVRYKKYLLDSSLFFNSTFSFQDYRILPTSAFINQFTNYNIAYKYERSIGLKLENMLAYSFGKEQFTLGFSLERLSVLPKTGDLPRPFNPYKPVSEQDLYYFGSDTVDYMGRSLKVPQQIYHVHYSNYGGYFQIKSDLNDFSLVLGSRAEYDSRYGFNWVPRIGLVLSNSSEFSLKFTYGGAYFAPSPHIAYQHFGTFNVQTDSLGRVVGLESQFFRLTNPNLKIERIKTFEIESDVLLHNFMLFGVMFYNDLKDLITYTFVRDTVFLGYPVATAMLPVNGSSGYSFGGTIGMEYQLYFRKMKLTTHLYYSYVDGAIDNKPLLFNSKHTVKAIIDFIYNKQFSAYLSLQYRSPMYNNMFVTGYSPQFFSQVFAINYKFLSKKKLTGCIYAKFSNILDQRYYDVTEGTFGFVPQDPLRFEIGIKFTNK